MKDLSRVLIFVLLFLFSSHPTKADSPLSVVISEIAWMGTLVSYNDEWLELYNNTGSEINLVGWKLSAQDGSPKIDLTGTISAKNFYLLERTDDETIQGVSSDQIYTGAMGNSGESFGLYDGSGNLIDSVICGSGWFSGDNSTKQTMERKNPQIPGDENDNWQSSQNPGGTPKAQNSVSPTPQPEPQTDQSSQEEKIAEPAAPPTKTTYPKGIVINEILPSPTGPDESEEWIEIFNQNNFAVDLSGWKIADTVGGITAYVFPQETEISPQEFLVLPRPTTKITLNNDGDGISLKMPDGEIVETVNYPKAPQGQSYNREESKWAWSTILTPGGLNAIVQSEISEDKKEYLGEQTAEVPADSGLSLKTAQAEEKGVMTSNSFFILLIASFSAISSGGIILILKKRISHRL